MASIQTWDISEGFGDTVVLVVDDAWSFALDTSTIPHLTLTGTHALGGVYLTENVTILSRRTNNEMTLACVTVKFGS